MTNELGQHNISVLLIDDEADIREIIRDRILEVEPMLKIIEASNGVEGLQKMSMQKFSMVITDLGLPKKNGQALLKEAQTLPSSLMPDRFIVVSGNSNPDGMPTRLGRVEFFSKPIKWELFLASIQAHVNSKREPQSRSTVPKTTPGTVDVEFINPFIDSTLLVLEVTAGIKARKTNLKLKAANEPSQGDMTSLIAMNSKAYLGSMAITFKEESFLSIVNSMLGENYQMINSENRDAAAELCNQIFGGAKATLNAKGHTIQPAIPTIITGKDHRITHTAQGPVVVIEFSTQYGSFTIEAVTEKRLS